MSTTEPLLLSPPHMSGKEQLLVGEAFDSNWIAPVGPMIERFEKDLGSLAGYGSVVALSSGTAALHLAVRLSNIAGGDEVWCPTMTFIGGVAPILYEGGQPVFFGSMSDTLLVDLDLVEGRLIERRARGTLPKVVLTTDLYGHPIDVRQLARLRDEFGFIWISDSAESVGSTSWGEHAGYEADFTIFSFNGNKIITTSGGGALVCRRDEDAQRARFLATQARDPAPHYEHTTYGYNYRLSNVCAAIGVGQVAVLVDRVAARRRIFESYRERLSKHPGIRFHEEPESARSNRWLTTLEFDSSACGVTREDVRLALEAVQIESRPLWKPMHLQPLFADAPVVDGDRAALAFQNGLCLPSGSAMSEADIDRVCEVIVGTVRW